MPIEAKVAAFEGGKLRILASDETSREVVLALPLNRLLVKMVRVPSESDPVEVSLPILKALSPFPDDPLTVSCETVREEQDGKVVIAAALPEGAADDIGEQLDAAKLSVVRIDALAFGQLRGVWTALGESAARRLVLIRSVDCLSLVVLDGDRPSAIRAISETSDLRREVMLSLLEAEDFEGSRKLEEIVVVENDASDAGGESDESAQAPLVPQGPLVEEDLFAPLSAFAPIRRLTVGVDAALVGVAERTGEEGAINALPESWREMLEEMRFKAKLIKCLAVAGGIWLLVVAVLFGVPVVYGFMTDHQKSLSKQHQRQYAAVKEMKAKVDLVRKYSDHARGALEVMKALSDHLPDGVTLSGWNYKREDGVRVSGEAQSAEAVYKFKDAMDDLDDEGGEKVFATVNLNGPNAAKGMYRFDMDCQYQKDEED